MAEPKRSKNEELYESGDIYPDLPDVVLDKIKKYHRIANAAIEPKRTVLMETHSKVIEMTETRRNIIGWMYQFERVFCKHPCIRNFNY